MRLFCMKILQQKAIKMFSALYRQIKSLLLKFLLLYKKWISPMLPHACRYVPTCSEYMYQAISEYGIVKGGWMGVKRLLRCHPWGSLCLTRLQKNQIRLIKTRINCPKCFTNRLFYISNWGMFDTKKDFRRYYTNER